jgi:hypothetical protein
MYVPDPMTGTVVVVVAGLVVVVGLGLVVEVVAGRVVVGATVFSAVRVSDGWSEEEAPTPMDTTTKAIAAHPHTGRRPTRRDNQESFTNRTVRRGCQRIDYGVCSLDAIRQQKMSPGRSSTQTSTFAEPAAQIPSRPWLLETVLVAGPQSTTMFRPSQWTSHNPDRH